MTDAPKVVLVVDDEPAIVKLVQYFLEREGYAVVTESTAEAAIRKVSDTSGLYAVLLDLGLPDSSGLNTLQKLTSIRPGLRIFVVTGSHDEIAGRQAIEYGAWDYFTKPIDFTLLKNALT